MNRRMAGGDASLNAQVRGDGDGTAEWQDWLEDEDADQARRWPSATSSRRGRGCCSRRWAR